MFSVSEFIFYYAMNFHAIRKVITADEINCNKLYVY